MIGLLLVVVSVSADDEYNDGDDEAAAPPGNSFANLKNFPDLSPYDDDLSFSYYQKSCPDFEAIVHRKVDEWVNKDYTLAPSLIRLHYQDCVVRVRKILTLASFFYNYIACLIN